MLLAILVGLLVGASLTAVSAAPGQSARLANRHLTEHAVDIAVPGSDRVIAATLAVPIGMSADVEFPAVLMLHGFGSSKDEVGDMYKREARYLARRGYASLRIDFAAADEGDLQPSLFHQVLQLLDVGRRQRFGVGEVPSVGAHRSVMRRGAEGNLK